VVYEVMMMVVYMWSMCNCVVEGGCSIKREGGGLR
jgi:hypothetical protein